MTALPDNPPPLAPIAVALAMMIASQIIRLEQTSPLGWLAADYGGRLLSLAVLWLSPDLRDIAFKREHLKAEAGGWTLGLLALTLFVFLPLYVYIESILPGTGTRLARMPHLTGWMRLTDLTFGLVLVATHEEIVFRRVARAALKHRLGDGLSMIVTTAALFGIYHWQFGIGTIVMAFLFGVFAMLLYKRAGTIAPGLIVHYVTDVLVELPQ